MNEATFTRNANKRLKAAKPGMVVWKVSDRFNSGRPDCHYLNNKPLYVEYKFEKCEKLPGRHTPALSALQRAELSALYARQPNQTRVIVAFHVGGKVFQCLEYTSPQEWENSTPLTQLRMFTGYDALVQRLIFLTE